MTEKIKTLCLVLLISFFVWDCYQKTKKIEELKETIFIQHQAINSQNILINFYQNQQPTNNFEAPPKFFRGNQI